MDIQYAYYLSDKSLAKLQRILSDTDFKELTSEIKILQVKCRYFLENYSAQNFASYEQLVDLLNALNQGNFEELTNQEELMTDEQFVTDLTKMFGLSITRYASSSVWENILFVQFVITNYQELYDTTRRLFKFDNLLNEDQLFNIRNILDLIPDYLINERLAEEIFTIYENPQNNKYDEIRDFIVKISPHPFATKFYDLIIINILSGIKYLPRNYQIKFLQQSKDEQRYKYIHRELFEDQQFVIDTIKNNDLLILPYLPRAFWQTPSNLNFILDYFEKRKEYVSYTVLENILKSVPSTILNYDNYAKRFIKLNPTLASTIPSQVDNMHLMEQLLANDHTIIEKYDINFNELDRNDIIRLLSINGLILKYLPDTQKNDIDIITKAIEQNSFAFEYVSDHYKDDESFVIKAIKLNVANYEFISERLKNSVELAKLIVSENWLALQFLNDELKHNSEIFEIATKQNQLAYSLL